MGRPENAGLRQARTRISARRLISSDTRGTGPASNLLLERKPGLRRRTTEEQREGWGSVDAHSVTLRRAERKGRERGQQDECYKQRRSCEGGLRSDRRRES